MFCPRCGSSQSDELKFCKLCGANLYAVRQVVDTRETGEKFDWSKTWVAEMFQSAEEATRRKAELERQQGLTPEVKRYNEIKAGVITASVGAALAIFLFVFMGGIVLGGDIPPHAVEILSRLWIAGIIPLFVGLALIVNGLFISKKLVEAARRPADSDRSLGPPEGVPPSLRSANTSEFTPSSFSATEETTRHLRKSDQKE